MCSGECLLVSCCVCCCRLLLQTAQWVPAQHGEITEAGLWSGGITGESLPVVPGFSWAAGRKKKKMSLGKMTEAGTRVEGKEEFPTWKLGVRVGQEALHKAICDLGKQWGRGGHCSEITPDRHSVLLSGINFFFSSLQGNFCQMRARWLQDPCRHWDAAAGEGVAGSSVCTDCVGSSTASLLHSSFCLPVKTSFFLLLQTVCL